MKLEPPDDLKLVLGKRARAVHTKRARTLRRRGDRPHWSPMLNCFIWFPKRRNSDKEQ